MSQSDVREKILRELDALAESADAGADYKSTQMIADEIMALIEQSNRESEADIIKTILDGRSLEEDDELGWWCETCEMIIGEKERECGCIKIANRLQELQHPEGGSDA